jgi:arsenate reductase
LSPIAVEVMAEVGIDISKESPKPWTDEVVQAADVVITMGCGEACPIIPGKRYEEWSVQDPETGDLAHARSVRDAIRERVVGLLGELGIATDAGP